MEGRWREIYTNDILLYTPGKNCSGSTTYNNKIKTKVIKLGDFLKLPHMESYVHIDDARKTCMTVYPNLATESQKYTKLHGFIWKTVIFEVLFCKYC